MRFCTQALEHDLANKSSGTQVAKVETHVVLRQLHEPPPQRIKAAVQVLNGTSYVVCTDVWRPRPLCLLLYPTRNQHAYQAAPCPTPLLSTSAISQRSSTSVKATLRRYKNLMPRRKPRPSRLPNLPQSLHRNRRPSLPQSLPPSQVGWNQVEFAVRYPRRWGVPPKERTCG